MASSTSIKLPISAGGIKQSKKIDMGAAANFGKASDLGINSPTHRNTHAEDLFSPSTPPASTKQQTNSKSKKDLLEDIFQTCPAPATSKLSKAHQNLSGDEFDPRSDEPTPEFGDFSSAFGNQPNTQTHSGQQSMKPDEEEDEFADFASAFTGKSTNASQFNTNNLFDTSPITAHVGQDLLDANMFGTSLAATSQPTTHYGNAGNSADLLSDFGGLNLGNSMGGKLFIKKKTLSFLKKQVSRSSTQKCIFLNLNVLLCVVQFVLLHVKSEIAKNKFKKKIKTTNKVGENMCYIFPLQHHHHQQHQAFPIRSR
jgi:hypothetical protein